MNNLFREHPLRIFVFLFSAIIGFFFLYASLSFNNTYIFLSSLIYLTIYLFITYFICKLNKNLLVFIISLLFSIGFLLKPGLNYLKYKSMSTFGWKAIGFFGFSNYELSEMYVVVIAGILGVLAATLVFNFIRYNNLSVNKVNQLRYGKKTNFYILFIFWILSYLFLIKIMDSFRIGIHGLAPTKKIGYNLIGISIYLRDFVFPIIGVMLMDISNNSLSKKNFLLIFFSLLFALFIVSIYSLSRGALFIPLAFLSFYIIFNRKLFRFSMFNYTKFFLLLIIAVFGMIFVNNYRDFLYEFSSTNLISNVSSSISIIDFFKFPSEILASRIEGSRELMAVIASPLNSVNDFLNIFFNTSSIDIAETVYGFNIYAEGRAYGITVGALGLLYTSKSILLVFFGMFFQVLLILYINHIFLKKGYPIAGYYFSCLWIVIIWNNLSMFFVYRYVAVLIILLLFIKYMSIYFVSSEKNKKII